MCSGGTVPRCIVDLTGYYLDLVLEETCNDCPVCTEQLREARDILRLINRGEGEEVALARLGELAVEARQAAACGIGRIGAKVITGAISNYGEEFEAHAKEKYCPAGVCDIRYVVEV